MRAGEALFRRSHATGLGRRGDGSCRASATEPLGQDRASESCGYGNVHPKVASGWRAARIGLSDLRRGGIRAGVRLRFSRRRPSRRSKGPALDIQRFGNGQGRGASGVQLSARRQASGGSLAIPRDQKGTSSKWKMLLEDPRPTGISQSAFVHRLGEKTDPCGLGPSRLACENSDDFDTPGCTFCYGPNVRRDPCRTKRVAPHPLQAK